MLGNVSMDAAQERPHTVARATAGVSGVVALDVVWPAGLDLEGVPCLWEAPAPPVPAPRLARPDPALAASERALVERLQLALGLLALGHLALLTGVGPGPTARSATADGLALGVGLLLCGVVSLLLSGGRFVRDQVAIGRLWSRQTVSGASTALLLAAAGALLTYHDVTAG